MKFGQFSNSSTSYPIITISIPDAPRSFAVQFVSFLFILIVHFFLHIYLIYSSSSSCCLSSHVFIYFDIIYIEWVPIPMYTGGYREPVIIYTSEQPPNKNFAKISEIIEKRTRFKTRPVLISQQDEVNIRGSQKTSDSFG